MRPGKYFNKKYFNIDFSRLTIYNSFTRKNRGTKMFGIFILLAVILLVSGGIGLFYINTGGHVAADAPLFFMGNLGSATFLAIGVIILVFIAFFNAEID